MSLVFYLLSFIYGSAIGSFVQVAVARLGVAPITKSRSKCLSCGETLRVSDLVPLFSYLWLRGKCRYCKVPYGMSSFMIEIVFGTTFMFLYSSIIAGYPYGIAALWLLYYTVLFIALGVIALYDLRHSYVPLTYLVIFLVLSLVMLVLRFGHESLPATFLGPLIVAAPFLLIWIISKGKALGFGDVLLFAGVGAFFGIEQGLAVLLISIWLGALVGIGVYSTRKKTGSSSAIPFVPFIVVAFLIVLFTDISVFSIASLFA